MALGLSDGLSAALVTALAYVLGGLPVGYLLARWRRGIDIRDHGSGNIGATNVARTLGLPWGIATFMLDAAKGALPVAGAQAANLPPEIQAGVGAAAVLGHVFSIFLRGRGGKGVATAAGAFAVLAPAPTAVALGVFGLVAGGTRTVGMGSVAAALSLAGAALFLSESWMIRGVASGVAVVVVVRHAGNLRRFFTPGSAPGPASKEPRVAPSSDGSGRPRDSD